jgi:hypothetical protein
MVVKKSEPYRPVDLTPNESWRRRFRFLAGVCLLLAAGLTVGIAVGTVFDVRWLIAGPRMWAVPPVTIPGFIGAVVLCAGLGLVLFGGRRAVWLGRFLLAVVAGAGLGWLVVTIGLGAAPINPAARQVPSSASAFGLAGVAVAGLLQATRRGAAWGQIVALLAGTMATVPLLGYLSGARFLAGFPFGFGEIAIPTIALILLTAMATAFARPDAGLIDVAIADSPGGMILRRFAIPVLLLPPVLVIAIASTEQRPIRTLAWVGSVLAALGLVALVATARTLDRSDIERRRAGEQALAMAAGLLQQAEVVVRVGESQGIVGSVPEGIGVAVRRAPAEGIVGGDAYSLMEVHKGALALTLIDIASKGAAPSVAAVRLRDVVTAALIRGMPESEALGAAMWLVRDADITATALVVVADPVSSTLRYASAGHVPALLLPPGRLDGSWAALLAPTGRLDLVEHTGPLLDRGIEPGWGTGVLPFPPGATLVAYTDGIADVIVRSGGGTSVERLATMLAQCPHHDPEGIVAWCMRRLESSPEWELHDDATMLVVQHRPEASHRVDADFAVHNEPGLDERIPPSGTQTIPR